MATDNELIQGTLYLIDQLEKDLPDNWKVMRLAKHKFGLEVVWWHPEGRYRKHILSKEEAQHSAVSLVDIARSHLLAENRCLRDAQGGAGGS